MATATTTATATSTPTALERHAPRLCYGEILSFAYETFLSNKVRFALTALGMVIGTASLILVVTIGLTGKQYVLNQIQASGANMMIAEYAGGGTGVLSTLPQDFLTVGDMNAAMERVPGLRAASPMAELQERVPVGGGKERDLHILGVGEQYRWIRNLDIPAGRFFDADDVQSRAKVATMNDKLAIRLYG